MYTQKGISHLFKIPTSNAKMKPIDANGRETLEQIYKRLPDPKPDLLFNGSMFDYKGGWPTGAVKIDGKNIQPNMGVMKHLLGFRGRDILIETHKTGEFTSVTKDMDSALESYPFLLPNLDSSGLNPSLVNDPHPRTAVGISEGFIHLLFTDGRNVSRGITSKQAAKELKDNGALKAIGLDGGSSTKVLAFGVRVNNQSQNSPIINAIGVWFDEIPFLSNVLRQGANGFEAILLQKHLNNNGFNLVIDGSFGPATENAVKAFQSKSGLTSDGIVGPKTWGAFKKIIPEVIVKKGLKIVLDAGHFPNTAGKRTPDDSMREYHFNSRVANILGDMLQEYEGVEILFTHSDDREVPLTERVQKALDWGADVFISIHANAYGAGWNTVTGIETYTTTVEDIPSTVLAMAIQSQLIEDTDRRDRGVKKADFTVLWGGSNVELARRYRQTVKARILVEYEFMTNKESAELLKSETYRKQCAKSTLTAFLKVYNLTKKKEEQKVNPSQPTKSNIQEVDVYLRKHNKTVKGIIIDGVSYLSNRQTADYYNEPIEWDSINQRVILG